jgi:long-chain fatty acid transport protein
VQPSGRIKLPLADAYRLDLRWQLTEDLAFSFGGAFEDWSTLDTTSFQVGNAPDSTIPLGFKDTYKIRGGVHYQVNEKWFAQTGLSYDSSALDNSDRTAALPIDEQWRWGIGGVYRYSEGTKVGFGFQYLNLGKAKINNPQIKGEYEQNHVFFFMVNVNFEKLPWDGMASF